MKRLKRYRLLYLGMIFSCILTLLFPTYGFAFIDPGVPITSGGPMTPGKVMKPGTPIKGGKFIVPGQVLKGGKPIEGTSSLVSGTPLIPKFTPTKGQLILPNSPILPPDYYLDGKWLEVQKGLQAGQGMTGGNPSQAGQGPNGTGVTSGGPTQSGQGPNGSGVTGGGPASAGQGPNGTGVTSSDPTQGGQGPNGSGINGGNTGQPGNGPNGNGINGGNTFQSGNLQNGNGLNGGQGPNGSPGNSGSGEGNGDQVKSYLDKGKWYKNLVHSWRDKANKIIDGVIAHNAGFKFDKMKNGNYKVKGKPYFKQHQQWMQKRYDKYLKDLKGSDAFVKTIKDRRTGKEKTVLQTFKALGSKTIDGFNSKNYSVWNAVKDDFKKNVFSFKGSGFFSPKSWVKGNGLVGLALSTGGSISKFVHSSKDYDAKLTLTADLITDVGLGLATTAASTAVASAIASGAAAGSIVPGLGTAAGAAVGLAIGIFMATPWGKSAKAWVSGKVKSGVKLVADFAGPKINAAKEAGKKLFKKLGFGF